MKKFRILVMMFVVILMLVTVIPVQAITDGELDGNGHPFVGLMLFKATDGYYYTCSGTLALSNSLFDCGTLHRRCSSW